MSARLVSIRAFSRRCIDSAAWCPSKCTECSFCKYPTHHILAQRRDPMLLQLLCSFLICLCSFHDRYASPRPFPTFCFRLSLRFFCDIQGDPLRRMSVHMTVKFCVVLTRRLAQSCSLRPDSLSMSASFDAVENFGGIVARHISASAAYTPCLRRCSHTCDMTTSKGHYCNLSQPVEKVIGGLPAVGSRSQRHFGFILCSRRSELG